MIKTKSIAKTGGPDPAELNQMLVSLPYIYFK